MLKLSIFDIFQLAVLITFAIIVIIYIVTQIDSNVYDHKPKRSKKQNVKEHEVFAYCKSLAEAGFNQKRVDTYNKITNIRKFHDPNNRKIVNTNRKDK